MPDANKTKDQLIAELEALRRRADVLEELVSQQRQMVAAIEHVLDDQRQMVEAMQQSEIQIAKAMVEAPFPIMIHAEDGEIVALNRAWSEKSGFRRDELPTVAAWVQRAFGLEEQQRVRSALRRVYGVTTRVDEGEFTLRSGGGEELVWSFSSAPLGSTADGRRTVISMAMDVTERRRAEEALRVKDFAIKSSISGIGMADLSGRVIYANDALLRMWGMTSLEQIVGRRLLSFWRDKEKMREIAGAMRARQSWSGEMQALGAQGHEFTVHLAVSTVLNEDGAPVCLMGSFVDVTEQKLADAALRRYAADLEARTQELDAFAHTVAHDLGNPLARVVGYAELLEEAYAELPADEIARHLNTIAQAGRHAGRIVQALLLLAGVRQVDEVPVASLDMGTIVRNVLERLELLVAEQQPRIVLPETWPAAVGYEPWIEEVWENYLSNALKYGGEPPHIELGWERVNAPPMSPPGGAAGVPQVRFWVSDNGAGIPAEYHTLLFSPFTRLPQTTGRGHGLGLSIVKRIVERLGGEVAVESEPGAGTCFSFTLPLDLQLFSSSSPLNPTPTGRGRVYTV